MTLVTTAAAVVALGQEMAGAAAKQKIDAPAKRIISNLLRGNLIFLVTIHNVSRKRRRSGVCDTRGCHQACQHAMTMFGRFQDGAARMPFRVH